MEAKWDYSFTATIVIPVIMIMTDSEEILWMSMAFRVQLFQEAYKLYKCTQGKDR